MYFLALNRIRNGVLLDEIGRTIPLHVRWTKTMIARGTVVQAGKWGAAGGVTILVAKDLEEAKSILLEDPLISSGLVTFEVNNFSPDVAF